MIAVGSSEEEEVKVCAEPAPAEPISVLNFNFSPLNSRLLPTVSPDKRDSPQLGDGIRSSEASGVFFDSLDTDGDGAIEPDEVAMFLQNEIGGKQFDTQIEVDEEVGTIMQRLDQNHNNGLEMSDMLEYWMQLETLLTAEEVSEWIVYSVQLPSSVGKIFLENGITGYDFLEIVDNGGEVLQNELGIEKASFRNKIVRQMQSRMLGIGSSPGAPQKFTFKLESCKAITLSWDRSTARVFPVHSYRLQRRAINLFGSESSINEVGAPNSNNFDSSPNSDWKTVYVGSEYEFVDSGLETGHNYMYRVQAWNSVGRSGWETIDTSKALKKQRCSTKPSQPIFATDRGMPLPDIGETPWEWMSTPKRVVWGIVALFQFVYYSIKFFLAAFALLAGMMRFNRATATSSTTATTILPFPWFWEGINHLSMKGIGQEIIPKTMLGDREAIQRQEELHDRRIRSTGLRGYNSMRQNTSSEDGTNHRNKDLRSALKTEKSASTGELMNSVRFGLPKEVIIPAETSTPSKFAWMRAPAKRSGSFGATSTSSDSSSVAPSVRSRISSKSDHPYEPRRLQTSSIDDCSKCSECLKRFRVGKRYKHHCSRCMATFCHKHGRTTHSNFTSCKVPGDCLCNSCLKVLSERSERSQRSEKSRRSST